MAFERLTVSISSETKAGIRQLARHYGITSVSALVALAIKAAIREIEKECN